MHRFGLTADGARKTLEEIGKKYNITRERVRQIENVAITTIKKSSAYKAEQAVFEELKKLMHELGSVISEHDLLSHISKDKATQNYLLEGRFLHSQVETPYGPRRCNDGGVWRFDPKAFRLERYSQSDYNNPWGIAFDRWEQAFISDASNGLNWWGLPVSAKMPFGIEIEKSQTFVPKRSRPTSGSEFISSRHFPDAMQGQFMICNSIGFLGIGLSSVAEDQTGFTGKLAGDLVASNDPNYRPVDLEFAPDGSLYFVDWHNALIGHMQHNARDPKRDRDHGRIYRITYPSRPLVVPAKVAGASIPELLENLKLPEYRTRYRTRRELARPPRRRRAARRARVGRAARPPLTPTTNTTSPKPSGPRGRKTNPMSRSSAACSTRSSTRRAPPPSACCVSPTNKFPKPANSSCKPRAIPTRASASKPSSPPPGPITPRAPASSSKR
jgi:hypothetical protein